MLKSLGSTTDADKKFFTACAMRVQEAVSAGKPQSTQAEAVKPQQP